MWILFIFTIINYSCALSPPVLSVTDESTLINKGHVYIMKCNDRCGDAIAVINSKLPTYEIVESIMDVPNWNGIMRGIKYREMSKKENGELEVSFAVAIVNFPVHIVVSLITESNGDTCILFKLDKTRTNLALKSVEGMWSIREAQYGSRVTFQVQAASTRLIPPRVVRYLSKHALEYMTQWLL